VYAYPTTRVRHSGGGCMKRSAKGGAVGASPIEQRSWQCRIRVILGPDAIEECRAGHDIAGANIATAAAMRKLYHIGLRRPAQDEPKQERRYETQHHVSAP
jgi:hypothetical protein